MDLKALPFRSPISAYEQQGVLTMEEIERGGIGRIVPGK